MNPSGLAVVTRTGGAVHWPKVTRFVPRTWCGREWVEVTSGDASFAAVTCDTCRLRFRRAQERIAG